MRRTDPQQRSDQVEFTEEVSPYLSPAIRRLDGWHRRLLWDYRRIADLDRVAVVLDFDADTAVAAAAALKHGLRDRLQFRGFQPDDEARFGRAAVFTVRDRFVRREPRRYIPDRLGVAGFLDALDDAGADYAVLRWFDELPRLPEGEDLDLLVADEAVEIVESIIEGAVDGTPMDLYSVSGLPGTDYKGVAYYPPRLARRILDGAIRRRGRWRAPNPRHHFFSLAHHVVYHKGEAADLTPRSSGDERGTSHDYHATLSNLARRLDLELRGVTLDDLDAVLDAHDWDAPADHTEWLSLRNPWLKRKVEYVEDATIHRGLSVFLIRRRAAELGFGPEIVDELRRAGFSILRHHRLTKSETLRLAEQTRGGNWGPGPWPKCGGPPAEIAVAFDAAPIEPTSWQQKIHPLLANARLLVKSDIRSRLNKRLGDTQKFNMIHSTDHGSQAVDYLRIFDDRRVEELVGEARQITCSENPGVGPTHRPSSRLGDRIDTATAWVKHWLRQLDRLAGYHLIRLGRD